MPMPLDKLRAFTKSINCQIPFLVPYWSGEEQKIMVRYFFTGFPNQNDEAEQLKEEVKSMLGSKYCLTTNLGRTALEVGLRALGLQEGDEVLVSSFLCRGVILPILRVGCVPVFVDIDNNFNPDPQSVKEQVSPKTRAIIISHLGGKAADIEALISLAKDYGFFVIDDAAQAFGGKFKGRYLGTWGDVGIFSFGIGKNLMATAGGLMVTDSQRLYEKAKEVVLNDENRSEVTLRAINRLFKHRYRRFSLPFILIKEKFYCPSEKSQRLNYYPLKKISPLDAALISLQLKKKDEIINKRRRNAQILDAGLKGEPRIRLPVFSDDHAFTKYTVLIDDNRSSDIIQRAQACLELARFLRKDGVEIEWPYLPLHLQKDFAKFRSRALPLTESLWRRALTLPVNPCLGEKNIQYIVRKVKAFFEMGKADLQPI